jgi:hypothetical protein
MQPIVNGLETEYAGKLAFDRRNATTPEGGAELGYYELRGHPSYVIVAPDGTLLWSGFGQVPRDRLRQQLDKYAKRSGS